MEEKQFLMNYREFIETYRKAHELCLKIQSELNDEYSNGQITYGEWTEKTQKNNR